MKIIVFDDDPTGSQSVYGCPLLLSWDKETLSKGIKNKSSLLFLLTNTRAMSAEGAKKRTKEICNSLKFTLEKEKLNLKDILFVSRGDSTLRGHGVLEPETLAQELGPFDATFHVPAFFEGGRTTVDGLHLLNGKPVHLSHFASDKIFGYSTSFLPDWLEEKSNGKISSQSVFRINLEQLQFAIDSQEGFQNLSEFLKDLSNNVSVVVDAKHPYHLEIFGKLVIELMPEKRFLFRSAASLISALSNLPQNSYSSSSLASLRLKDRSLALKSGLIMVGSHVKLADIQLEVLLQDVSCKGIELPVKKVSNILDSALPEIKLNDLENLLFRQLKNVLESGKTPVLYTTRGELYFTSISKRIFFGLQLAELMSRLARRLAPDLGYVISKGGITTQLLLEKGLGLGIVELKGQILPGLSLVCPYKSENFNRIPIITFPGNLGDATTLFKSWKLMQMGS